MNNTPIIVTVAGFDPSGGAGLLADIKTFSAMGIWGMSCISTYTIQTAGTFTGVKPLEEKVLEKTLRDLFENYRVTAFKIGLITEKFQVDIIAKCIDSYSPSFTLIDPIIRSSTGFEFWDDGMLRYVADKIFGRTGSITPNAREARKLISVLTGNPYFRAPSDEMALSLNRMFRTNIAVTGGDSVSDIARDIYYDGVKMLVNETPLIDIPAVFTHGTGCTFSSALLGYQSLGNAFLESCKAASEFTKQSIKNSLRFNKKQGGLNHMWRQNSL
ncbi:MAG: bifunctional hydroxymethylpyrimidine kinase/phosphomethylpyrimidine kinase [Oligoflexia bacterium]|nr:bifunctional hydroxymethylpyrimidine kinase/phosphomethylpyrimidine kinase [Oligoflexia bacterium]